MEVIKKVIKRIDKIIPSTGCTNCGIIVPDTGVTYYIKISLTQDAPDIGFFDASEIPMILLSENYGADINPSNNIIDNLDIDTITEIVNNNLNIPTPENENIIYGIGEELLLDINYI